MKLIEENIYQINGQSKKSQFINNLIFQQFKSNHISSRK